MPNFSIEIQRESRSKLGRIKARAIRSSREAFLFRAAARNAARQMKRQFEKTVTTWERKVVFTDHVSAVIGGSTVTYEIRTTDRIWHYLDEGTSVRYKMSNPLDPYISKTEPTVFGSTVGSGSMIWGIAESGAFIPAPGIEARRWSSDPRTHKIARQIFLAQVSDKARQLARELNSA